MPSILHLPIARSCLAAAVLFLLSKNAHGLLPGTLFSPTARPSFTCATNGRPSLVASPVTLSSRTVLFLATSDDDNDKIAECKSVLRKVASGDHEMDQSFVFSSLEDIERLTRKKWRSLPFSAGTLVGDNAANRTLTSLQGSFRLVLVADVSRTTTGHTRMEYLPPELKVVQTMDTRVHPMNITNTMHLGLLPLLSMSGSFHFLEDSRQVNSNFDHLAVLDISLGNIIQPIIAEAKEIINEGKPSKIDSVSEVEEEVHESDEEGKSKGAFSWMGRLWRWGKCKVKNIRAGGKKASLFSGTWDASFTNREKDAMEKAINKLLGLNGKGRAGLGGSLLRMEQTFNLLEIPAGMQWDIYVGDYLVARLLGRVDISLTNKLLPKNIGLDFGRVNVLGVELDLVRGVAGSTFTWICIEEEIAIAQDEDGGLFLFKRLA